MADEHDGGARRGGFDIADEAMVVTTSHVMRRGLPVRYAGHELDEDGAPLWQFHCEDGDFRPEVLMLRLSELLALEPGLAVLPSLPVGYCARRDARLEWTTEPCEAT